jgi:hypothetical protein
LKIEDRRFAKKTGLIPLPLVKGGVRLALSVVEE